MSEDKGMLNWILIRLVLAVASNASLLVTMLLAGEVVQVVAGVVVGAIATMVASNDNPHLGTAALLRVSFGYMVAGALPAHVVAAVLP